MDGFFSDFQSSKMTDFRNRTGFNVTRGILSVSWICIVL